nr:beta-galactosidase [Streptomyces sp. DH-12]
MAPITPRDRGPTRRPRLGRSRPVRTAGRCGFRRGPRITSASIPTRWADLPGRATAPGLTAVDPYVPWNVHEPHPGRDRSTVPEPAGGSLTPPGAAKGLARVGGPLLGRHRETGPRRPLCPPAPLPGGNTLTPLELERLGDRVEVLGRPDLGPAEEYVETF